MEEIALYFLPLSIRVATARPPQTYRAPKQKLNIKRLPLPFQPSAELPRRQASGRYARTAAGARYVRRVLDPSLKDSISGIPDGTPCKTVFMDCTNTTSLQAPTGVDATKTWDAHCHLIPHPIIPFSAECSGKASNGTDVYRNDFVLNDRVDGANHNDKMVELLDKFQRWRLAYMSATIKLDANAVADQGIVAALQMPVDVYSTNFCAPDPNDQNIMKTAPHIVWFESEDNPSYARVTAYADHYHRMAREGVYLPLKMSDNQRWRSARDLCVLGGSDIDDEADTDNLFPGIHDGAVAPQFPFANAVTSMYYVPGDKFNGDVTCDFLNQIWGIMSFKDLSPSSRLTVTLHYGIEFQVNPSSTLVPYAVQPSLADPVAMAYVARVTAELGHAYPASYNEDGTLWDLISGILNGIAPYAEFIPEVGPVLSYGMKAVSSVGNSIQKEVRAAQAAAADAKRSATKAAVSSGRVRLVRGRIARRR